VFLSPYKKSILVEFIFQVVSVFERISVDLHLTDFLAFYYSIYRENSVISSDSQPLIEIVFVLAELRRPEKPPG